MDKNVTVCAFAVFNMYHKQWCRQSILVVFIFSYLMFWMRHISYCKILYYHTIHTTARRQGELAPRRGLHLIH